MHDVAVTFLTGGVAGMLFLYNTMHRFDQLNPFVDVADTKDGVVEEVPVATLNGSIGRMVYNFQDVAAKADLEVVRKNNLKLYYRAAESGYGSAVVGKWMRTNMNWMLGMALNYASIVLKYPEDRVRYNTVVCSERIIFNQPTMYVLAQTELGNKVQITITRDGLGNCEFRYGLGKGKYMAVYTTTNLQNVRFGEVMNVGSVKAVGKC